MGITGNHPCLFPSIPRRWSPVSNPRVSNQLGEANSAAWSVGSGNPWRRLSLRVIGLLIGFLLGTSITTVAGALGQMDPVVALIVVIGCELTVRCDEAIQAGRTLSCVVQILDMSRIGLLYGLFLEAFKLI